MADPVTIAFGLVSTAVAITTGTISITVSVYKLMKWGIGAGDKKRKTEIGARLGELQKLLENDINKKRLKDHLWPVLILEEEIKIIDKALELQSIIYVIIRPVLIKNFLIVTFSTILICFFISIDFKSIGGILRIMPGVELFDLFSFIPIIGISYWAFKQTTVLRDESLVSFFNMTAKIENLLFIKMHPVLNAYNSWADEMFNKQFDNFPTDN